MAKEVFNRYEHKYLLSQSEFDAVRNVVNQYMTSDKYNKDGSTYTISNIYYDTNDDYLIRNSLSKPVYKEKLRLRGYGIPSCDDYVFFEIKKKVCGIVNKRRTKIRLCDAYSFLDSKTVPQNDMRINKQVLKEIVYFLSAYRLYPKLYLAYDRYAYFERDNPDLRVTFDTNIRARRYDLKLEDGDYGEKLLDDGVYLMEIKTALAKPLWLVRLLDELDLRRQSFSKYGTVYTLSQISV